MMNTTQPRIILRVKCQAAEGACHMDHGTHLNAETGCKNAKESRRGD